MAYCMHVIAVSASSVAIPAQACCDTEPIVIVSMNVWCGLLACFVIAADAECLETLEALQVSLLQSSLHVQPSRNDSIVDVHPHVRRIRKTVSKTLSTPEWYALYIWPVFAIMVFAALMTITLIWDVSPIGAHIDMKLSLRAELKMDNIGWYEKLFFTQRNVEFGKRAEVAFRGAVVFALYGFPFFLPKGVVPFMDTLIVTGVYSSFIGQQILFSFMMTVGGTLAASAQLAGGTFLALSTIWVMFGFFPNGVANDTDGHAYVFGIISGASAVLVILLLNIPLKMRIFYLVRFSEYWMAFLNPTIDVSEIYSTGFEIKLTGKAVNDLAQTFVGCMLALAASLFPFPRLALTAAEEECCVVIGLLTEGWKHFYSFMEQKHKREDMMNKMQKELFLIKRNIDQCDVHLGTAWWECFGMGSRQRARVLITGMNRTNFEMYIQLLGAVQCCTADDTFAPQHLQIMGGVREPINNLIRTTGETRTLVAKCLCLEDRDAKKKYVDGLKYCAGDSAQAIKDLTTAFLKTKARIKLPEVHEECFEEHVFCRSLCAFGRDVCDLAERFIEVLEGTGTMSTNYDGPVFSQVFSTDVIFAKDQLLFTSKTAVTFALTFLVGYFGYGKVIMPYTDSIPGNMALLITPGTGLQHTKNLMRLEGVVLGTAMGLLFVAFVGTCSWLSVFLSVVLIILWIWLNLIGHFSGQDYAYLCFLLALFGQLEFLKPCTFYGYDPSSADFTLVFNVVTTIVIMTSVDMCMPTWPASQQAAECLRLAWSKIAKGIGDVFDPECPLRHFKGEIIALVARAKLLGEEADQEPRFWKTAWRQHSFQTAIDTLKLMNASVRSVHDCMPGGKRVTPRDKLFLSVLQLPSMLDILKLVQNRMDAESQLMQVFTHEKSTPLKALDIRKEITDEHIHALTRFASDANALIKRSSISGVGDSPQSLESDCACKVAHIVACLYSMRAAMLKLQSAIVING